MNDTHTLFSIFFAGACALLVGGFLYAAQSEQATFAITPTTPSFGCTITPTGKIQRMSPYRELSCDEYRHAIGQAMFDPTLDTQSTPWLWLCWLLDPCAQGIPVGMRLVPCSNEQTTVRLAGKEPACLVPEENQ